MTIKGFSWFFTCLLVGLCLSVCAANSTQTNNKTTFSDVMQLVAGHCSDLYSLSCMQFDVLNKMDSYFLTSSFELLPGVYLAGNNSTNSTLPAKVTETLGREIETTTQILNSLLAERMFEQLKSWSLRIYLFGNNTLENVRGVFDRYLGDKTEVAEGRRHRFLKYMTGTFMTVAFSILSAIVSKSLTLSLIAIGMSLLRNAGGGGGGSSDYKSYYGHPKPIPQQHYHDSHSTEVQYVDELPEGMDQQYPYVYYNKRLFNVNKRMSKNSAAQYDNLLGNIISV